jgi:hypothetical protein
MGHVACRISAPNGGMRQSYFDLPGARSARAGSIALMEAAAAASLPQTNSYELTCCGCLKISSDATWEEMIGIIKGGGRPGARSRLLTDRSRELLSKLYSTSNRARLQCAMPHYRNEHLRTVVVL